MRRSLQLQNSLAYGGDVCDVTATATTNGFLFAPTNNSSQMCAPPQDTFFVGDGFPADVESRPFTGFFGANMEHELKWDDFSTTTTDMLCRQASDGIDDLAAYFFSDENRVAF
jgi:hypothetical protein